VNDKDEFQILHNKHVELLCGVVQSVQVEQASSW